MPISEGVIDGSALSETTRDPLQIPDFLCSLATHLSGFSPSRPSSSPTSEVLSPELIAQCLEQSGTVTLRKRWLPMAMMIWSVVGMALLDMRAARSRLRLAAFGIDIDHEANGVYLPRWQSHTPMSTMKNAEAHTTIHTNTYYLNVEYLLEETIAEGLGRNGILQILRDIGDDLKSGEFPLKQRLDQRL